MNRDVLVKVAENTFNIIKAGEYKNRFNKIVSIADNQNNAVKNTILYKPEDSDNLLLDVESKNKYQTIIEVTNETSLQAAKRLLNEKFNRTVVLNFASAKNPGGGVLKGSIAQEESLARASGLYDTLIQHMEMYNYNRALNTSIYSDYMIYSPDVPVFKDDNYNLLDKPYNCSFITMPAPNAGAVINNEFKNKKLIIPTMKRRIEKVLAVAVDKGYETIVLGAFGCGVFKNNPVDVATLFKLALDDKRFKGHFKKVVFAIYDKIPTGQNVTIFKNIILK